jgi:anti-anti-sigma factor
MTQQLPNSPLPSDWRAQPPASRRGRLKALPPSKPILEVFPLEQGRGLRLVGELCLSTVGDLLEMLDTLPDGADVIDLGDLSFMDSSGLHAFELYARTLEPGPLVLRNPSPLVRRLFELTGAYLNPEFEVRSDDGRG